MIQEALTHVSAPLSAPFKALMAQKRIFKKRNYPPDSWISAVRWLSGGQAAKSAVTSVSHEMSHLF